MKNIKLLHGEEVKVDDKDYDWLSEFRWYLANGYAYTNINGKPIAMHVLILKTPKGKHSDHINHNKLDNQRQNLRIVEPRVNILHRRSYLGEDNPFYDKRHSDEFKRKVSIRCSKSVSQLSKSGVVIQVYPNTLTAERQTGISNGNISSACRGIRKSAGGYKWQYVSIQ